MIIYCLQELNDISPSNKTSPLQKTAAGYLRPQAKKIDYGILALYLLSYRCMEQRTGLEPAASRLTDEVTAICTMARSMLCLVGSPGFEPGTRRSSAYRSTN